MRMPMQDTMTSIAPGRVTEMACMVHIRREFVKVFVSYQLPVAGEAIERIAKLYDVEKQARFKSPADRVALRQEYAKADL